jgi:alginate O-acetyltransferase complex protein AlgI
MEFNSFTFIAFFAVVLFLHRLRLPWRVRKFNLLWLSYVFYAAWNPPFVLLLWFSTLLDWFTARGLERAQRPTVRRLLLCVTLAGNLGLLGYFKYGGFLLRNLVDFLAGLGIQYHPAAPDVILPVGISFYTFQTLSYSLDVYLRRGRAWDSFLDYALYVTFFPQLVAGPILRSSDFLPQCREPKRATGARFAWGLSLIVLGLFEKMVVADNLLAPVAERVFDAQGAPTLGAAWVGVLAFGGQIFCDFAGYSTTAIGAALCLGFAVPSNFRFPYAAIGFSDFWRRWHVSLSSWLRDYLYIPLGGNRKGRARTYVNLMATMLLGGLWHGASWTFVAWGGLHGAYLVVERLLKRVAGHLSVWRLAPVRFGLGLGTFGLVSFAWVFFRAKTFTRAWEVAAAMLGLSGAGERVSDLFLHEMVQVLLVMTAIVALHWRLRNTTLEAVTARVPWVVRSLVLAAMLVLIVVTPGEDRAFIYFQF